MSATFPSVLGDTEIQGIIGSGASATVYLGYQRFLERRVAVKALSAELAGDPAVLERFRLEAELMARLDHPNCVRVYSHAESGGHAYIVSELVEGATLRRVMERAGRLTPEQSLGVVQGALRGLQHAHERGLVHRDVKPDNVLVDLEGTSKLADFGMAAVVGTTATLGESTGSAAYMSPEQVAGGQVDARTDVYSAAALLFELLTGRPPFTGDSPLAVMRQHQQVDAPDARTFNPSLDGGTAALLARGLAKSPEHRQQSAAEMLGELEAAALAAHGPGWQSRSSIKREVELTVGAGMGLLAALGVSAAAGAGAAVAGSVGTAVVAAASSGGAGATGWVLAGVAAIAVAVIGGGAFVLTRPNHAPTVAVASPSPSPSLLLAVTPDVSPTPSPTAEPSPTPAPSPSPTPVRLPSPTPRPSPSRVPSPTPAPPPPGPIATRGLDIYYSECDASGGNCGTITPAPTSSTLSVSPCGQLKVYEQYTWDFPGSAGTNTNLTINWTGTLTDASLVDHPYSSSRISITAQSGHTGVVQDAHVSMPTVIDVSTNVRRGSVTYTLNWTNPNGSPASGTRGPSYSFSWGCG